MAANINITITFPVSLKTAAAIEKAKANPALPIDNIAGSHLDAISATATLATKEAIQALPYIISENDF